MCVRERESWIEEVEGALSEGQRHGLMATEGSLSIVRATLQCDTPISGVELSPYVMCRRRDGRTTTEDIAEGSATALEEGYYTRCVWQRSTGHRKVPVCTVHPDRKATVQCMMCLKIVKKARELAAAHGGGEGGAAGNGSFSGFGGESVLLGSAGLSRSYHCSPACYANNWARHKVETTEAQAILDAWMIENGANGSSGGGATANPNSSSGNSAGGGRHTSSGQQQQQGFEPSTPPTRRAARAGSDEPGASGDQWRQKPAGGGVEEEGWEDIFHGRTYVPTDKDVGHVLRFECQIVDSTTGEECGSPYRVDTARVINIPPPPYRGRVRVTPPTGPGVGSFTVLTYNVLADLYANKDMYRYCPAWALSWSYRRQNLIRELLSYDADIMCLQEVQSDHFDEFKKELEQHGYVAVFKKKTNEVFTGGTYAIDGCATFFREKTFTLVKRYDVEFNKAASAIADAQTTQQAKKNALNRLLKNNVALIIVLEAKDAPDTNTNVNPNASSPQDRNKRQLICLANTHIHANQELKDVKLWQVHTLLKGLEKIAASADIPMVVCGDFNSIPGSAPHSLITDGLVVPHHKDLENDPLGILKPHSKLCHNLPLVSGTTTEQYVYV